MDEFSQLKSFHHEHQLKVYMYDFMYIDPDTMPVEDYFPDTKMFIENCKKMSILVSVPKHWLGFSFICL